MSKKLLYCLSVVLIFSALSGCTPTKDEPLPSSEPIVSSEPTPSSDLDSTELEDDDTIDEEIEGIEGESNIDEEGEVITPVEGVTHDKDGNPLIPEAKPITPPAQNNQGNNGNNQGNNQGSTGNNQGGQTSTPTPPPAPDNGNEATDADNKAGGSVTDLLDWSSGTGGWSDGYTENWDNGFEPVG